MATVTAARGFAAMLLALATLPCWAQFSTTVTAQSSIKTSATVSSQVTPAFAEAISANDLLVCGCWADSTTSGLSVTDAAGSTWSAANASAITNSGGTAFEIQVFYALALAKGAGLETVTCNYSIAAHAMVIAFHLTGNATSSPLDGTPATKAVTTAQTSITNNSYSSSGSSDALISFVGTDAAMSAFTAGASQTVPTNGGQTRGGMEYQLNVAASSYTPAASWTSSVRASISTAGFLAATAAATDIGANKRHRMEQLEE